METADMALKIVALNIETMKIFFKLLKILGFTAKAKYKESSYLQILQ